MTGIVCGVDASMEWLDAHVEPSGQAKRFANTPEGIAELAGLCRKHDVELVCLEASGVCSMIAFLGLWDEGVASAMVNPRRVRRFSESMGWIEKTDALDARAIARFAIVDGTMPQTPPGENQQRLNALAARLRQVSADTAVEKQRRHATRDPECRESIDAHLAFLGKEADRIVGEIGSMIDDDPLWQRLGEALREVKGVADRSVAYLLAEFPEIGTLSGKAAAKLAGLAPIANDSGKRKGKRPIREGRAPIRGTLFVIALQASRYHDGLAAFRKRLLDKGKDKKLIRIALARKLLVILNAKVRDARAEIKNAT